MKDLRKEMHQVGDEMLAGGSQVLDEISGPFPAAPEPEHGEKPGVCAGLPGILDRDSPGMLSGPKLLLAATMKSALSLVVSGAIYEATIGVADVRIPIDPVLTP